MSFELFIGAIGGPELLIVLVIAIFLFGADRLPKLARSSGQALGEFHKGRDDIETEIRESAKEARVKATGGDEDESDGDDADPEIDELAAEAESSDLESESVASDARPSA